MESAAGLTVRSNVFVNPPQVALMVTTVEADTPNVVTVNVLVLVAAMTVADARTVATAMFDEESVTRAPVPTAFPVSVTVPVELFPPTTGDGAALTAESTAGSTVKEPVFVTPAYVPEIVRDEDAATPSVVTVKVVDIVPAVIVTDAGTVAAAVLELLSVTRAPPVGAFAVRVTVPVTLFPPAIVVGFRLSVERAAGTGLTVSAAVLVNPP